MTSFTTFYLSRVIGKKVFDSHGSFIGVVRDLLILFNHGSQYLGRPPVIGIKIKKGKQVSAYSFQSFKIEKVGRKLRVSCKEPSLLPAETVQEGLFLAEVILDKQIVDLHGRKLVRVNDVRLVSVTESTHAVAVDIGMEGLLRRIGISRQLKFFL